MLHLKGFTARKGRGILVVGVDPDVAVQRAGLPELLAAD